MEVVPHHQGIEVYERPPPSATQHSTTSTTPPPPSQFPQEQAYDPYHKYPQSAVTYDGTTPHGTLPQPPPSQYYPDSAPDAYQKKKKSWVLPAIVGVLVAILVGAAVGGGLGASLKSCESNLAFAKEQQSSGSGTGGSAVGNSGSGPATKTTASTTTITLTAGSTQATDADGLAIGYAPISPDRVGVLSDTCNKLGGNESATSYDEKFSTLCDADIGNGPKKNEKGETIYLADLVGIVAYSYKDCLNACSSFSSFSQIAGVPTRCKAFTFRTGLAGSWTGFKSANCWLKNSTAYITSYTQCKGCISGELQPK
ncbi:hypothetical protein Micbo1qcDRAFT_230242 [Microdochium bolleyi]|uniref:Apple domain-containing protein n=1 Tax=Microdochium bolleyi TaxID=196109 RepID=A0A136JKG1_9PEZI|nr:hypothetical protein Micbo1qcDRAFT_230242 [Microdochium bolleyi]